MVEEFIRGVVLCLATLGWLGLGLFTLWLADKKMGTEILFYDEPKLAMSRWGVLRERSITALWICFWPVVAPTACGSIAIFKAARKFGRNGGS